MRKSTFIEIIAFVLIFGLGAYMFERGFFWSKEQESVLGDRPFLCGLTQHNAYLGLGYSGYGF
ncbi:MAG: hypothetical protein ABC378_08830 [Staphylococcus pseudoxylosus]|uniref:hypothetical protein n=1 Tax=Staphylococcus pseudoxylosus TaxID=2282419 RepID=UPI0031F636BF